MSLLTSLYFNGTTCPKQGWEEGPQCIVGGKPVYITDTLIRYPKPSVSLHRAPMCGDTRRADHSAHLPLRYRGRRMQCASLLQPCQVLGRAVALRLLHLPAWLGFVDIPVPAPSDRARPRCNVPHYATRTLECYWHLNQND